MIFAGDEGKRKAKGERGARVRRFNIGRLGKVGKEGKFAYRDVIELENLGVLSQT